MLATLIHRVHPFDHVFKIGFIFAPFLWVDLQLAEEPIGPLH
jgi:hypothetical protein